MIFAIKVFPCIFKYNTMYKMPMNNEMEKTMNDSPGTLNEDCRSTCLLVFSAACKLNLLQCTCTITLSKHKSVDCNYINIYKWPGEIKS